MRHSLEGQGLEIEWIRDNACALTEPDYYRMCLKKTSWYTCIYPLRAGALVAGDGRPHRFDRFGWYLGAAFQIQDDLLNLDGEEARYGKEIAGDLWEGKRTLMIIHLLRQADARTRARVRRFLGKGRGERTADEVRLAAGPAEKSRFPRPRPPLRPPPGGGGAAGNRDRAAGRAGLARQ